MYIVDKKCSYSCNIGSHHPNDMQKQPVVLTVEFVQLPSESVDILEAHNAAYEGKYYDDYSHCIAVSYKCIKSEVNHVSTKDHRTNC